MSPCGSASRCGCSDAIFPHRRTPIGLANVSVPARALDQAAAFAAPASFDEAYRHHAQCVARWARNLGGADIEVEDVVQEVFLVVSRRLNGFRGEARFSSWLFEITRRIVANHRRRHRWRFWTGKPGLAEATASQAPDPAAWLDGRRAAALFYQALDQLPEKYRTVLVLFEIEGLSTKAIADLRELRPSTVNVQLLRARRRFLTHYQQLLEGDKP
jgi:RNA polymerase sigma factor (sigma-70 family)